MEGYIYHTVHDASKAAKTNGPATAFIRNISADIVDRFEALLESNGSIVPNEDREDGNEAPIYGETYSGLLDDIGGRIIPLFRGINGLTVEEDDFGEDAIAAA